MTKVLCLVPVRNAAVDLPGFFESAARFADGVLALDDGSTDDSLAILQASPLVKQVLSNPRREDYRGWDDAGNRNQLLKAAAAFEPEWIISLDADERIDRSDALALREFLDTDAIPGVGYGFRCYSMVGDLEHALPNPIWVYRLFAFAPGQRFPDKALHFAPIPTSIPKQALLRTSFRIQHLGGMSPERRRARYEKYRQADPDCRFWPDYSSLLKNPGPDDALPWTERDPAEAFYYSQPAAEHTRDEIDIPILAPESPRMSVIVLDDGPEDGVARAIASANTESQIERVLVRRTGGAAVDGFTVVEAGAGASRGAMRNAGLRSATGAYVCFLDGELSLAAGACERLVAAHSDGYAIVTGGITTRAESSSGTAAFVYRFGADRPRKSAGIVEGPPRWASYSRALLLEFGGFSTQEPIGEEIGLNRELTWRGYLTYRIAGSVAEFRPVMGESLVSVSARAFRRGGATAGFMLQAYADRGELAGKKFLTDRLVKQLPRRLKVARRQAARLRGTESISPRETAPLAAVEVAQWAGQWGRLLRPERGKALVLAGRPAGIAALAVEWPDSVPWLALARFDLREPYLRSATIPADLLVSDASGVSQPMMAALGFRTGSVDRTGFTVFSVQDAIGRSFDTQIDDLVWIDGRILPFGPKAASVESVMRALGSPSEVARLVVEGIARRRIWTTMSRRAVVMALSRLRTTQPERIAIMTVPVTEQGLDNDTVSMVREFLDVDRIRRPMTQREALKRVEWA